MNGTFLDRDAMMSHRIAKQLLAAVCVALAACPGVGGAQCVPGREYEQSAAVKSRYPDPPVRFATPGFAPGKTGFTSHAEMMQFVQALARRSDVMRLRTVGESQEGRVLPLLVFSDAAGVAPAALRRLERPIVFLMGQVHGNEPAGGEAMLALAQALAEGELKPLLDRVTVVILPRANPDGAHYFWRATANCVDVNRDHVKVDLPETAALRRAMRDYPPHVFVDAHEFSVATRWIEKFGLLQAYDFTMQYATHPNVPAALTDMAERVFRRALARDVEQAGYSHFWYYTTGYNVKDKRVFMGGTAPDIGRNYAGLGNAISLLIESRGVGIGRDSYTRRVHTHYVVMASLLRTAAANAAQLVAAVRAARDDVVQRGRSPAPGDAIAVTTRSPMRPQKLTMMHPQTGELAEIEVEWSDSLAVTPGLARQRPFAYLVLPSYGEVARRLMLSGVEVRRLREAVELEVEGYEVTERRTGGVFLEGHVRSSVSTEVAPRRRHFPAGSYVYLMAQPQAHIAALALEPESPASFVSLGLVPTDARGRANPQEGAPSEVPIFRLLQPTELDALPVELR